MPLRDHFATNDRIQWQGVLGGWPMMMVKQLNAKLDSRSVSSPNVHLGSHYEIDIGTVEVSFQMISLVTTVEVEVQRYRCRLHE